MPLDPVLKKFIDKAVAEGRTATDIGKSISEAGWGLSHIQEAERYYGSKKKSSQSTSGTGSGESTSRGGVTTSSLGLPQDIVDFSIGQQKKYGLLSEEKQPIINPNKGYVWETTEPEEDSYGRVFNAFSEIEAKRKEIEETSASPTYRGPVNERPQYYRPTGFPTSGFGMGMGAAMGAGIPSPYDTRPALSEDDRQARIAQLQKEKKEAAQSFIKQSEISYNALLPKAKAYGEEVPDFYDFNGDPSQGIEWVTSKAKEYQKEQLSKLREEAVKEAEKSNWAGRNLNSFVYNFIGAADALGAAINFASQTAVGGKPWEDDYTETELGKFAREGSETVRKGALGEKFLAGYTIDEIQKGFIQNIVEGNYEAGLGLLGLEFLETLPQLAAAMAPGGVGLRLLATTSAGDAWARVANDPKYNTAEKIAYAGLLGLAEYYTEKIFSADRDAIRGMFGIVQEKGKKGLGDAMFGRLPKGIRAFVEEGFEESVVDLVTQGLDYAMAGKEFDAYQLADATLLGGTMGGGAFVLSKTPSALGRIPGLQTKIKFDSDIQRIKDILDSKDLSPEERGVLKARLDYLLAESRMTEEQNMMFYQSYSEEDKKRTYELNREVLRLMELHKKTKTDIAKKAVTDEIKQKISEIEQIEKKYDSKKEQQVPSQVAQGKELGPVPIEGRSAEEAETSGILQEVEDEEKLAGEKTQALEQEQPDLEPSNFDNVTEETAPTVANTLYGYISNTAEAAFKALGTSRRQAARAADSVANVIKSLTKAGKKVNVKVFYSKASMEDWLGSIGQKPEAARGIYVPPGSENKNEVTIGLLAPALLSNTAYHEGLHSIVPAVFGNDGIKRLFKVLMNNLSESDALGEYLRNFVSSAAYRESEDRWEEFSVELASLISDGSVRVSVKKGIIDKFMDAMSEVLGIVGIDVKPSAAQLVNILNDYAQKLGAGVELGKIPEIFDTEVLNEMANGDIESVPFINTEIVAPTNVKRQDIVFPESGTYPVSKITKSDVKDIEAFLKEQVKLGKNFAFWYADQFGRGNYVDPYTGEEYFLDGGPSFPFDPENKKNGDVWATGYKTPMALYKEFVTGKKGKKRPDFIVQISGHPRRMMFFNKTVNKIWIERARAKYKDIDLLKKELTSISNIKSISFFVKNTTSWEQMLSDLDSNESVVIDGKTKTKSDVIKKAIGFVKEINPKPLGKKGEIATSTKLYNLLVENGLHPDNFDNLRDGFFKEYDFNEGEILCIYKATDIVPNANTHGTYAHSIKGEPVLVPDAKVSAWGLMPEEVRRKRKIKTNKETGEKTLGKELQDLPKSAIQKAMAPDYPTVYPVTEDEKQIKRAAKKLGGKTPRKVMRMALEGYNEKPQAMAGQRLFNEPLKEAADIADKYYEKEFNEARPKFNGVKSVDKERAKRISDAYIEMEDNYFDPEVKKAYDAMIDETLKQFDFIVDRGYKVVINNEEPYKNSEDMITDLRDNKVMRIFSTESGFGDEPITEIQRDSNPLLKDSGRKDANGIPLLNNDLFRFVHDFFGHAELGNGFGAVGEENAWNVHARMYSPLARRAMTSETRGQNSYVNFSGVNEEAFKLRDKAREERKKGNDAEADKLLGEVYEKMKFADQKVGLLPEEMAIPDGFEDTKPKVKRMALTDTFKEASAPNFITEEDRREFQSMSLSDTQDEANNELWSFVQRRNLNEEQIEEVLESELWDEVSDSVKQNEERIEEEAYYENNPHEKQLEDFSDKMEAYEDFDFTIERAGTGTSYVTVSKLSFDKNGRLSKEDVAQIRFANHMRAYNPKNPDIANYDIGPDYNTTVDGVIKKIVGDTKPKAKRMAIVPSESMETPSQIDDRAGELLLELFKGTKYFDRVKSIKRQPIIDPESRKKYEKALKEKDGRALYNILGNQDAEKAIAFAKEKFPIRGSLAAMADRVYLPTNSEEVLNFGSTVIYSEYQKYLNKELKDIVNESTLDPKDLLREVGYELFNPKNLTEARESFLHFYENGKNICTLNIDSVRFQESFVTFIVKDDAAITPMADKLTQDNLTKDWKDYLEKKGRKNADGTYNLNGIGRDSLDPYSTSVVSLQINKSNGVVKEISRYNHQIGSPDNIFNKDFNKIIDGLEDAMFKKFSINKNINQSREKIPYGIIQDNDGRFFNYIFEQNGVYYGDGFYLEGGVATRLDNGSQRMVDGFVINANGKVEDVINSGKPFFYGDVLKVNYIKGNEISLKTVNGDFVFEVKNGAVSKLINFPKVWVEKELDKIASYTYDSEGGIVITNTRYSDDFLERINMLWSDDIVGFETSMDFSNTKIQSLGKLKYITGNANFSESNIQSLGELMYIGGNAWFSKSQVQSLGELRYIGTNATFIASQIQSLGKLRYIGGDIDFAGSVIKSLGELRFVRGSANFFESRVQSLGKLRYVGTTINTYDIQSLGELRYVGTSALFPQIQDKSFEELRYVGGHILLGNLSRIESLGNLSHVGHETRYSVGPKNIQEEINNLVDSRKSIEYGLIGKEEYARVRAEYHQISKKTEELVRGLNQGFKPNSSSTIEKAILEIDEVGDAKPKVKRQVTAWHGSPYDFEKFKTENIGTGEGAQAFGWGLYFTDLESVARDYAKKLSGDVYSYDGKLISKEASDYLFLADNSFGENFNENTIRDIAKVAINKIKKEYIPDLKEIAKTSTSEKQRSEMPNEVKKLEGIIKELENVISSKEIKLEKNKALYKVSLHKGKTPIASSNYSVIGKFIIPKKEPGMSYEEYSRKARRGEIKILKEFNTKEEAEQWLKEEDKKAEYTWLEWDKPLTKGNREKILNQLEKEGFKNSGLYYYFENLSDEMLLKGEFVYGKMAEIGGLLPMMINNEMVKSVDEKQASLFLLRAGIDGVKYPVGSIVRFATSDNDRGYNYVVFDENAVTIENKIKFQKISKAKNLKKDVSKVSRMSAGSFSGRMYNYLLSLTTENDQGVREIAISKAEWMNTMAPIIGANEASDMYDNVLNNNIPQDAIDTSLTSNVDKAYEDSLSKIERETKKAIFTIENLIVKLIDRQHLIKAAVLKANISRVKNLIVNKAGSSARALHFIRSWENRIYKGLNDNEATLLDKVIVLRRIKTIDDNFAQRYNDALNEYNDAMQQLSNMQAGTPAYDKLLAKAERAQKKMAEAKPPAHPEGINGITASLELARIRESIGDDAFNNINERASEYFDAFSSILDEMYRENMISEKLYEQLAGLDYQPRVFLEHMFEDMDQNMMTEHRLTGPIIKRLKEGSDKEMLFNSKYLLRIYAKNAFSRIARNKIHKELAKYAGTQDWISSSPRTGFSEVTFYGEKGRKKGVQQTFYLKNDLYNSLNDVFKYAYLSPKAQNIIGMISGARLLKFFATQVNPLFVVKNIPRDFAHILFFTDFYDNSPLPVAAFRLGMDYINGIKSKITEDKWFNLYLKYGGGMEFLSTEGEESAGLGYVSNAKKTMMGKLGMKASEILGKSKESLGYLGELSEIAPRIGIFKALVERNLREANVDIRSAAAEPIIEEAVAMVREIIDFAQGGELTKAGESAIPYLNAAFQGFRVASRYAFVSNPKQFAYKLAQLSVAVFALALYNSSVGDDDMEDISDDIKFRNWIILTPFRDKDGNRYYLKIAKTQQLQSFAYLGEIASEVFVASQKDREPRINDDLGEVALKAVGGYLPKDVGKLDKEIATANPFLSAIYTYKSNYDAFRDDVVSRDYAVDGKNKVLPQYEDFYNKDVPYFYKAIGQGLGVGPKRLQASTEKMITSPHSSLLVMGGYALADSFSRMFELKGPDGLTLKDQSDISKSVAERFNVDAKKIFLGVTNPETKSYEKREQIDESNMDSNTRRMFIKREADKWGQKLYEMRNQPNANTSANIDTYNKTIDSIYAELSSIYDKQGEQTAEYFRNRVFIVAKKGSDIPQEYNDLLFASDDVARAKILYMYDKSMSEQEIYDYMGSYSEAVNRNVSREQNIRIAEEYNKLKK